MKMPLDPPLYHIRQSHLILSGENPSFYGNKLGKVELLLGREEDPPSSHLPAFLELLELGNPEEEGSQRDSHAILPITEGGRISSLDVSSQVETPGTEEMDEH